MDTEDHTYDGSRILSTVTVTRFGEESRSVVRSRMLIIKKRFTILSTRNVSIKGDFTKGEVLTKQDLKGLK